MTPTPTPSPIPWPTPTFLPTQNPTDVVWRLDQIGFKDYYARAMEFGVQTWHTTNRDGTLDLFLTFLIFAIVLYGLYTIWQRVQDWNS